MGKRVFITKKEAREFVNNLNFAYHDYGRHLGLDVKIHNFPKKIQKVLWESYSAEVMFEYGQLFSYITPLSTMWIDFKSYLKQHYDLDASQAGRSGGYWGVHMGEYNSEEKVKKAIRKAFYYATVMNFNVKTIRLFEYSIWLSDEDELYFDATQSLNGETEYYVDGVSEWVNYMKNEVIPIFERDDDDSEKWKSLANAYNNFLYAWKVKKYVCNVA